MKIKRITLNTVEGGKLYTHIRDITLAMNPQGEWWVWVQGIAMGHISDTDARELQEVLTKTKGK